MTPQELETIRGQKVSDDVTAKQYAAMNPQFAQGWGNPVNDFKDRDGKPMNWNTVALNAAIYGNPYGPDKPKEQQSMLGSFLSSAGSALGTVADYATAPAKMLLGGAEAVASDVSNGLGAGKLFEGQDSYKNQAGANAAKTASILPAVGATVGDMSAGPMGAAAGGFAGKAVGNLIDVANDPSSKTIPQLVAEPAIEGAAQGALSGVMAKAGPAVRAVGRGTRKMFAGLSNVADETLQRAFSQPEMMSRAIEQVNKNVKQPFFSLAQKVGNTLSSKLTEAEAALRMAKEDFTKAFPKAKFDVSSSWEDVRSVLKEHNISLHVLPAEEGGNAAFVTNGVPATAAIRTGKAKPLDEKSVAAITEYANTILGAKRYSPADILDLKDTYKKLYRSLDDSAGATKAQAILQSMKEKVDENIKKAMPEALKNAYANASNAYKALDNFGDKFVTTTAGKGGYQLADNAEGWLSNLWGAKKGQMREDVQHLSDFLGIDIAGESQLISDAKALSHWFPATGSRQKDILSSLAISKAANVVGGLSTMGAMTGTPHAMLGLAAGGIGSAATSPKVVGEATMTAGRMAGAATDIAGSRAYKAISGMMSKLAPAEKMALYQFLDSELKSTFPASQNQ